MNLPIPRELPSTQRYEIGGNARVLLLPDVHVPYHDAEALTIALAEGKRRRPTHILLNGDAADFYALSFWERDPRRLLLVEEIGMVRAFLECVRETFPKAEIIYNEGNHEYRLTRYIFSKAPELFGLPVAHLEGLLDLGSLGITYVPSRRVVHVGKLPVLHGHEYRFAISNPVNPARGLFLRAKTSALCSHFHARSDHSERTVEGKLLTTWSTGCLCNLAPEYSPLNNWSHGFAYIETDKQGAYDVQNLRIYKGRCYN